MTYDSTQDTLDHISRVAELLNQMADDLRERAKVHDQSKLVEPEKSAFDAETPLLKTLTYGSEEYWAALARLSPALHHHYENNSHHPEHYKDGVVGMNILDVVEMLCDWKAATERMKDGGNIEDSIYKNDMRFGTGYELTAIFVNTARHFGWMPKETA